MNLRYDISTSHKKYSHNIYIYRIPIKLIQQPIHAYINSLHYYPSKHSNNTYIIPVKFQQPINAS
jgi:hypothetical protein